MELPEEVINETRRRGIDVVDLVINAISRYDPMAGIKMRVELAKRYLEESNCPVPRISVSLITAHLLSGLCPHPWGIIGQCPRGWV